AKGVSGEGRGGHGHEGSGSHNGEHFLHTHCETPPVTKRDFHRRMTAFPSSAFSGEFQFFALWTFRVGVSTFPRDRPVCRVLFRCSSASGSGKVYSVAAFAAQNCVFRKAFLPLRFILRTSEFSTTDSIYNIV
ncbi:MAG: hypothetical protein IJU32_05975, partial [Pyramidobacter sp.]|nr:hypothetical protein [Pyramidobacter sp.]